MSRLGKLSVAALDNDQRALYDAIVGGPRAGGPQLFSLTDEVGRLEGPFNAMLLSPRLGSALQSLGTAVRYGSAFTDRGREIAILVVAHSWRSEFEIYAHELVGRAVGVTNEELQALRDVRLSALADPSERVIASTAHALACGHDLDDEAYAAATAALGMPLLFELTTLVGYYATLALQLRVFRVAVPA